MGFFLAFYWTASLNTLSDCFGYFYFAYVILGLFLLTLVQAIMAFLPNDIVAMLFNPIFTSMIILFCGVTTKDLHSSQVYYRLSEFFTFNPPSNQTCAIHQKHGGYLSL
ncbi:ATP-binding cassette transporter snq2 [Coemansia furcata]|uniref:ATP-binding cassette transporter snq2 n=1 Tax=Coemansia furcata TaxID=417177 RepID=A0ACC1LPI5_9FUNG|nr:ATP-binding cassette transporter snq2 [Coemansia furcata]